MRTIRRLVLAAVMAGTVVGVSTGHASADPGRTCVRADIWIHPLTYMVECVGNPNYPTLPASLSR